MLILKDLMQYYVFWKFTVFLVYLKNLHQF